jgi:hypothetical protein
MRLGRIRVVTASESEAIQESSGGPRLLDHDVASLLATGIPPESTILTVKAQAGTAGFDRSGPNAARGTGPTAAESGMAAGLGR